MILNVVSQLHYRFKEENLVGTCSLGLFMICKVVVQVGVCHLGTERLTKTVDPSAPIIIQRRTRTPTTTSTLFNLYLNCDENRTKNKRGHFKKLVISVKLGGSPGLEVTGDDTCSRGRGFKPGTIN